MIVTCPRCPKTWTGTTASHCPACHETFSVDSNGERHRKGAGKDRHCVHPSTVGLVLNRRGRWAMPGVERTWEQNVSEPLSAHLGHSILFRSDTNESFCDTCGVLLDLTPLKTTETRSGQSEEALS